MDSNQNSSGMSQPKSEGLAIDISALAESAKAKLGEIGGPVKDKAMEVASEQISAGADHLRTAAQAVNGAARELESNMPEFAGYVRDIGSRLETFASDIRDGSVDDLLSRIGEFSKNQPALMFGGAMIAGFALSRFLKSSAQVASDSMGGMSSGMHSGMQSGSMTMQSGASTSPSGIGQTGSSGMGQGGYSGGVGTINNPGRTGGGI
jgi:hypothetical protein